MNTVVRKVLPIEYEKYRDHLLKLNRQSRYLRFGYHANDVMIHQLCDRINQDKDHHILFCVEDSDLQFIGICHIALGEKEMELAFSVLDEYQGNGIGNALMRRAIAWCRTNKILKGVMVCLSNNEPIRHLCKKYGMNMESELGETIAQFTLDNPDSMTYFQESTDINIAVMDWIQKRANHLYHLPFKSVKSDT
jgi:RimJ/RimL family protein N-acetyltransferase